MGDSAPCPVGLTMTPPPKTKTGARTVSLDEQTVAVLRAHKARQNTERLAWGELWSDSDLHPSASIGPQAGESLREVSSRLGHSTIVITADIYVHISPELAKESAERLARLVRGEIALDGR